MDGVISILVAMFNALADRLGRRKTELKAARVAIRVAIVDAQAFITTYMGKAPSPDARRELASKWAMAAAEIRDFDKATSDMLFEGAQRIAQITRVSDETEEWLNGRITPAPKGLVMCAVRNRPEDKLDSLVIQPEQGTYAVIVTVTPTYIYDQSDRSKRIMIAQPGERWTTDLGLIERTGFAPVAYESSKPNSEFVGWVSMRHFKFLNDPGPWFREARNFEFSMGP